MLRALSPALLLGCITLAIPAPAQWQIVTPSPTTSDLRGIDNAGNGAAWASGANGAVLRTVDSGSHWQLCTVPPGAGQLDFAGIQAFDASTAFVISTGDGPLSRLYKTTDGCRTWTLLFTNPMPDSWDAIAMAPPRLNSKGRPTAPSGPMYILGSPVNKRFFDTLGDFAKMHFIVWVMKTPWRNGERPDRLRQIPPAMAGESAPVVSNSILYPVGYAPLVFFPAGLGIAINSPRGPRWLELEPGGDGPPGWGSNPMLTEAGCPSFIVSSVAFRDWGAVGVAVGGDPARPNDATDNTAYTHNGGQDWNSCLSDTSPHGFRTAVAYDVAANIWIAVGPNGTDISTDDGHNWHPLRPDPQLGDAPDADQHWTALSLPYAVGPGGRIGILRRTALTRP